MKSYKIAVLAGDGIGPEITREAIKILNLIEQRNNVSFELLPLHLGPALILNPVIRSRKQPSISVIRQMPFSKGPLV